ncbi:hypothetical protein HK100_009936 [Physocladia obscura]|uniref:Uncharacterized protein n=1 Tax=Physocladia obscura TaxID=109957 RepID=A0AAD5T4L8_9FUNG|nr:hypothetical protein HK100_009936 [Physocladia obscura]
MNSFTISDAPGNRLPQIDPPQSLEKIQSQIAALTAANASLAIKVDSHDALVANLAAQNQAISKKFDVLREENISLVLKLETVFNACREFSGALHTGMKELNLRD